jgi:hypothetical protein
LYHESIAELQALDYKELQQVTIDNGVTANTTRTRMLAGVKRAYKEAFATKAAKDMEMAEEGTGMVKNVWEV